MTPRNIKTVIEQMIEQIPDQQSSFVENLRNYAFESIFKAPEDTATWEKLSFLLQARMPIIGLDWHFRVLSIFSTIPEDEIREMVQKSSK